MGVRDLTRFIETCGVIVPYDKYTNRYVAIDIFQKIYKYCTSVAKFENPLMSNPNMIYNKHLKSIINCVNQLMNYKIIPVFVFDGNAIQTKMKYKMEHAITLKEQEEPKNKTERERNQFRITPKQITECKSFIHGLGLPYIRAPFEADSQCAAMAMVDNVNVDTVITEDTDVLVFGSKSIVKMLTLNIFNKIQSIFTQFIKKVPKNNSLYSIDDILAIIEYPNKNEFVSHMNTKIKYSYEMIEKFGDTTQISFAIQYNIEDICEYLKTKANIIRKNSKMTEITSFTYDNFVDMCILFGNDYIPRITNIPAENVFDVFIRANMDVDTYISMVTTIEPMNYKNDFDDAKNYYKNASVIDPKTIDMTIYRPMEDKLIELMCTMGFSRGYVETSVKKYSEHYNRLLNSQRINQSI